MSRTLPERIFHISQIRKDERNEPMLYRALIPTFFLLILLLSGCRSESVINGTQVDPAKSAGLDLQSTLLENGRVNLDVDVQPDSKFVTFLIYNGSDQTVVINTDMEVLIATHITHEREQLRATPSAEGIDRPLTTWEDLTFIPAHSMLAVRKRLNDNISPRSGDVFRAELHPIKGAFDTDHRKAIVELCDKYGLKQTIQSPDRKVQ